MPHLSSVGRRSAKSRFIVLLIYTALIAGGVTMVVPFILMLSISVSSQVDRQDFVLIPRYFTSDAALYRKYVESAFNEDFSFYQMATGDQAIEFRTVKPPKPLPHRFIELYQEFKRTQLSPDEQILSHSYSQQSLVGMEVAVKYQAALRRRYNNDIEKYNRDFRESLDYFSMYCPQEPRWMRAYRPVNDLRAQFLRQFKLSLPSRYYMPAPIEGNYRTYITGHFTTDAKSLSAALKMPVKSAADLRLSPTRPENPAVRKEWDGFVRTDVPLRYVTVNLAAQARWGSFLRARYGGNFELYRREHPGTTASSFESIPFHATYPGDNPVGADWSEWIERDTPYDAIRLATPEIRFREWLCQRFVTTKQMNAALGASFASFEAVYFPYGEELLDYMKTHSREVRWNFVTRNYQQVFSYLVVRGRAFWNTFVFVLGTIVLSLTVNPMAAFALSRFKLRSTYKILIFLLATMAFPAEVSAIPGFLLIKKLHLLNTFWALLLPGMAAGFSIFLLKGFFDSLPQELYESAQIDGASDWLLFTRICLPMSSPVLAVIALGAFGAAYGSFMWAFIVCQKKAMWTLMVWIQQLSLLVQQPTMFAALVLAAVPTLLVFIFCQNIIMRGVILPMEK